MKVQYMYRNLYLLFYMYLFYFDNPSDSIFTEQLGTNSP